MKRLILTLFAASLSAPMALGAQATLVVLSKADQTLVLADPVSLRVLAEVPTGEAPRDVVVSPGTAMVYVSHDGSGSFAASITVLDLLTRKPPAVVDVGGLVGPYKVDFAAGKLWFAAEGSKAIGSFDPVTLGVARIVGIGEVNADGLRVWPDGREIIGVDAAFGNVSFLQAPVRGLENKGPRDRPASEAILAGTIQDPTPPPSRPAARALHPPDSGWSKVVVPVGKSAGPFDVSPDGREVWVAHAGTGAVTILDAKTHTVSAVLQSGALGTNTLRFTPDGRYVLLATLTGSSLVIIDAHDHTVVRRMAVCHGAGGVLPAPDGLRAFVACTPDGYVAVVALPSLRVVGRIVTGGQPEELVWAVRP